MLIATGIMAVGLVMVATIFPVGVKLTTLSTERTIGAVAADEAFAKIQLYGLRDFAFWPTNSLTPDTTCTDYQYVTAYAGPDGVLNSGDEHALEGDYLYPSADVPIGQDRNYHWSALCRRTDPATKEVQVTVFVSRKIAAGAEYHAWEFDLSLPGYTESLISPWPKPVPVNVDYNAAQPKELVIKDGPAFNAAVSQYFFDDGYTVVDNLTGQIYRVLEVNLPDTLVLMEDWQWDGYPLMPAADETDRTIWVVPPAVGSDRYPCVGVYQRVIRFDEIN